MRNFFSFRLIILIIFSCLALSGCLNIKGGYEYQEYLKLANNSGGLVRQNYLLKAANQLVLSRQAEKAQGILNQIDTSELPPNLLVKKQLLQANVFLLQSRFNEALGILTPLSANANSLSPAEQTALNRLLNYAQNKQTGPLPATFENGTLQNGTIALLLPLHGPLSEQANSIKNGFFAAYDDAKQRQPSSPSIAVYDTSQGDISTIYKQAVAQGAKFVVGPLAKPELAQLLRSTQLTVPTLALNTLPTLQNSSVPNLYQFTLSPNDEAQQVATKARNDHHSQALVIAPSNSWGQGIAQSLKSQWLSQGGRIVGEMNYSSQQSLAPGISRLLQIDQAAENHSNMMRHVHAKRTNFVPTPRKDVDVIFVIAQPVIARQIRPLLKFYYAGNIPVYSPSIIYTGSPSPNNDRDLDGVIFCDMPWVLTPNNMQPSYLNTIQERLKTLWASSYYRDPKLYALGVDAYDVVLKARQMSMSWGVPGATGTLYLTPNHYIYRKLIWAQMEDGTPRVRQ